jgi:hypothetical protein
MKLFWQTYTWPKLFVPPRRPDVIKNISVGRRFGKSGLTYHSIVDSLSISDEKKKELHELYKKELRGEE